MHKFQTAQITDAALSLNIPFWSAPVGINPVNNETIISGPVVAVRHYGSVDVFLEKLEGARSGDVLVIDNQGRTDEGCIGDLVTLEAKAAGLGGIIVWGFHRDTSEISRIGLPVFSYGHVPMGPQRLDPRPADEPTPMFGDIELKNNLYVFADDDGVIFINQDNADDFVALAKEIAKTERRQASAIEAGTSLRAQLRFDEYLELREQDADYSFRIHLAKIKGEIER